MSSSGKDFDQTSLASNAPLLQDKDPKAKDGGLLTWLRRSQKHGTADGSDKSSAAFDAASSSQQAQQGQSTTNTTTSGTVIEDLYKAYPNMGTSTRLS
jgi:hypothetical protein